MGGSKTLSSTFITLRSDASRLTRNGAFIMEAIILASLLSCADAQWIITGVNSTELSQREKSEIILEVKTAMADDCVIDDDARR